MGRKTYLIGGRLSRRRKGEYHKGWKKEKMSPYKSTLEHKIATEFLSEYLYEPKGCEVGYIVPHKYIPDFIHPNQPEVLIECKGWFIKGSADCQKYISIARDNPDKELVFIFSDPLKRAYSQCRTRKDGTYMTLAEWCIKNNFMYYKADKIPRDLAKGRWSVEDIRRIKQSFYENQKY